MESCLLVLKQTSQTPVDVCAIDHWTLCSFVNKKNKLIMTDSRDWGNERFNY